MDDRFAAPDALHPQIHAREVVRGDVVFRHDHLGGKRFVIPVAGPIKVSLQDNSL